MEIGVGLRFSFCLFAFFAQGDRKIRTKAFFTAVISLVISLTMFATASADPDGNSLFPNCYTFYADGTWDDPGFPELGAWSQDSNGASTSYAAGATALDFDIGVPGASLTP